MNKILIKIVVETCQNVYGTSPCTASGAANLKCYNSFKTCQDQTNYTHIKGFGDPGAMNLYFINSASNLPEFRVFPHLESYKSSPPELKPTGLALQDKATIRISDFSHSDEYTDPYLSDRTHDPLGSTFWPRFVNRHEYQLINAKVFVYFGDYRTTDELLTADYLEYLIKDWRIDEGGITFQLADPLSLLDPAKTRVIPSPRTKLATDLPVSNESDFYLNKSNTLEEITDYGARHVRINDEIIFYASYSGGNRCVGILRGQWGTTPEDHKVGDTVTECRPYNNVLIKNLLIDLLELKIPSSRINTTQINAQFVGNYESIYLDGILSDFEEKAQDLINDICKMFRIQIYWNRDTHQIEMKTLITSNLTPVMTITDDHILEVIECKLTDEYRLSRFAVYSEPKDYTKDIDEAGNYQNITGVVDDVAGGEFMFNEHKTMIHYGRFIGSSSSSFIPGFISKSLNSFRQSLWQITLEITLDKLGSLVLGDHVDVDCDRMPDYYGGSSTVLMFVQSIKPNLNKGTAQVKLLENRLNNRNYAKIGTMKLGESGTGTDTAVMF